MKKRITLALAGLLTVALSPAIAGAAAAKMMPCKGRMVVVDMKTHVYSTNMHWKVTKHKMVVMSEAAAKAKGNHMMMSTHMTTAPVVNPKGALNADKGATPNPDNNANGVHTTAEPKPTPTP